MLKLNRTGAAGLLALAAMLALPGGAEAACTVTITGTNVSGDIYTRNTCIGTGALLNNVSDGLDRGINNTALGDNALNANTIGDANTASGASALRTNTTGSNNTASGRSALRSNTTGSNNTASGRSALFANTTGENNTASGVNSLNKNSTGSSNTASGVSALQENTIGNNNTASGVNAMAGNTTGGNNTAFGAGAMQSNTTGSNNTALGVGAGSAWTVGNNNIAIGNSGVAAEANTIRIGTPGVQTRIFIAGIRDIRVTKARTVMVNALGQLGTSRSSIRYKEDVQAMGDASKPLMNLRPVTFRYKEAESDGSKPIQYGLIAEEVEKVMPDLVIYNDQGAPESVAYETLPSLLLNEYQKQGRKLADAEAKLATAESRLAASDARFVAMEAELAALKLAISRLAAAPSAVKLAATAP